MTEGPDPRFAWATPRTGGVLAAAAGTALLGCIVWQPAGRAHGAPAHFKFLGQHQEALRIPGVVPVEDKTPLPPLPALPRLKASSTHQALQLVASTDVYFGGGSFAARQKSTVLLERQAPFERSDSQISALAGYAGSKDVGPGGLVCYHGGQPHTVYEGLGDAQVVQVSLRSRESPAHFVPLNEQLEFKALLADFFASFRDTPGAGYQFRNCIGIPGGMPWGPLYRLVAEANINNVELVKGVGDDPYKANTVYVYDTRKFPFHRAETFLQFKNSPATLKAAQLQAGRIGPTGCTGDL